MKAALEVFASWLVLAVLMLIVTVMSVMCGGCGSLDRADPAARSNRATITIAVTAHGDNSHATGYVTDGLLASADGEGSITQPSSMTTTQNPEFSGAVDPVSAGIVTVGRLAGKVVDAKLGSGSKGGADSCADCGGGGSCASCGDAAPGCTTCK